MPTDAAAPAADKAAPGHDTMPTLVTDTSAVVAILMCVHAGDDPDHFREAVASLQAQTYRAIRLYVYCDGPVLPVHDAILATLNVADGRDCVVRGAAPIGLPGGLNCLIERALEEPAIEFLARMDADDISVPTRIERQVNYLRDHTEVAVVGTWCIEFTEPGVPVFFKKMPTEHAALTEFMLFRSPFNHPSVMFRREVLALGHRYDPSLKLMQDYDLWTRLVAVGFRIGNVPEYLLWFRIAAGFYTRRSGVGRAGREIAMRIACARSLNRLRMRNYPRYLGLFLVRVAPVSIKKLSYRYLRSG